MKPTECTLTAQHDIRAQVGPEALESFLDGDKSGLERRGAVPGRLSQLVWRGPWAAQIGAAGGVQRGATREPRVCDFHAVGRAQRCGRCHHGRWGRVRTDFGRCYVSYSHV